MPRAKEIPTEIKETETWKGPGRKAIAPINVQLDILCKLMQIPNIIQRLTLKNYCKRFFHVETKSDFTSGVCCVHSTAPTPG